jgi:hypothetical protein
MAVKKALDDKIHAPAGVGTIDLRTCHPSTGDDMPARTLPAQVQSLPAVDPAGPLMIDAPALAPKQDMDPPIIMRN